MFNQLLLNGIIAGSIYALVAIIGFTIIYRTVKFFHFAHGVIHKACAHFAFSLSIFLGINTVPSFCLNPLTILGIATDRFAYLP